MASLFQNIRFYILVFSAALMALTFIFIKFTTGDPQTIIFTLTRVYAFIALVYLYVAIIATPLTKMFPRLPYRAKYLKARRAIGVSAFFFALTHAILAFFNAVGGFSGFFNSPPAFQIPILYGVVSLFILFLMAATSFDIAIEKLTFEKWKNLHRFVYIAGILILLHSLNLGSDLQNRFGVINLVIYIAVGFLLVLESIRLFGFLNKKFNSQNQNSQSTSREGNKSN